MGLRIIGIEAYPYGIPAQELDQHGTVLGMAP